LAALLVDAGRVVPVDTLIDRVWGEAVAEQSRATLQVYVSRIRRLLGQFSECDPLSAQLSRVSGGYLLAVDPDHVDIHRFRRLSATDGAGIPAESLREALALWQGPPLTGVDGGWAERTRALWGRERIDAAVAWARAELALANPRPVLAGLAELANDNPLVESVTEVLMLALHAAGRPSEALDLYARTRTLLAEELGTDPGPDLQALHQSLLRGEVAVTPVHEPSQPVPRQLPAPAPLFTGRAMELADLNKIHDASTVVITAIDGMAGIGKTALAVQAAHQMVDRYPDGQLFIDLHGYTDGVAPVQPGEALDWLLRSLGIPGERVPHDVEHKAGLYRSRLAEKRTVIVLDNAASETQVRPLLPGAPGCVVLITSRRRLAGLDHTHTLSLDTLPPADAVALLCQTAGDHRLAGQPMELQDELVELCGRVPLAIRIAAARLRSHLSWDLDHLVRRLRDQQQRLVELQAGERSVTAALDLSYQDLDPDQQRAYGLLSLHLGPNIDAYAAAALLDTTLLEAGRLLEQLLEAHLLQEPVAGRYRFHDLTRAHAAHTASRDGGGAARSLDRLLDYFLHTAAVAMDVAYPFERECRPRVPSAGTPSPMLSDLAAALEWLDSELSSLLSAAWRASERNRPAHLLHFSGTLHRHLRVHGPYHDAEALHQLALTTARAIGQPAAEAEALAALGNIHRIYGPNETAIDYYQRALRLARAIGHRVAEVQTLVGLGGMHYKHSRKQEAIDHHQQAIELARAIGYRAAELEALVALGHIHGAQGWHKEAIDHYRQALGLARAIGHRSSELEALVGVGHVLRRQGRYEQAVDHYQQALGVARAASHRNGELYALTGLGLARRIQGRYEEAAADYQRVLDLANQSSTRNYQLEGSLGLGQVNHATGDSAAALAHLNQALALAIEEDVPDDQARAHDWLAHAYRALDQTEQARTHWQHALDILTRLGVDHTDDAETSIAAIRGHLDYKTHR
jgi:tetratricopeptide (TPR) repeat protein/DNA-binding SARP family transcriptional activator